MYTLTRHTSKMGIALTTLILAGQAWAADFSPPPAPQAPGQHHRMQMMLEVVDASDAQRQQIEAIVADHEARMRALRDERAQLREAGDALKEMGPPVDLGEVRRLADQAGELFADSLVLKAEMRNAIASVLTPQQLDKLERLEEMRPRAPRPPRPHRG